MKWFLLTAVAFLAFSVTAFAADKKQADSISLKIVVKKDKYKFDGGGKTAKEYKAHLEDLAAKAKKGELGEAPKPPAVDLVLQLTNTSKNDLTIYVGGDANIYTFELTGGAGTVTMGSGLAFTADFRLPKAVSLAAGKTYEIPVKQLSDGSRGASRYVFWTGPGEYKLSAKYTLADRDGGKGSVLESKPVKITVTEK
jgi:hypothetical protein